MFSRAREAYRILSYREPNFGPDAIIAPEVKKPVANFSVKIARTIELLLFAFVMGKAATIFGVLMFPTLHPKGLSLVTIGRACRGLGIPRT